MLSLTVFLVSNYIHEALTTMLIYTLFQPIYIGKCLNIRCKYTQNTFNIKENSTNIAKSRTIKNEYQVFGG